MKIAVFLFLVVSLCCFKFSLAQTENQKLKSYIENNLAPATSQDIDRFYSKRNFESAWITRTSMGTCDSLLALIRKSDINGLDKEDYDTIFLKSILDNTHYLKTSTDSLRAE